MWVRSQDGRLLLNVTGFRIEFDYANDDCHSIIGYSGNTIYNLAIYSTSYQCMDVLDEIESVINNGCPFVYKMPEDGAEANTVDETMIPENKDFYGDVLVNAIKKREEVEEAVDKFKEGFHACT